MATTSRRRRLDELNKKLDTLERTRDLLEEQLDEVDIQIRDVQHEKAPFAPLYTLPDELLVLVLDEVCLHDFPKRADAGDTDQAMVMSQVSRRWRSLTLSLPRIWTCVHLSRNSEDLFHIFNMYITRSQPLPLSIASLALSSTLVRKMKLQKNCGSVKISGSVGSVFALWPSDGSVAASTARRRMTWLRFRISYTTLHCLHSNAFNTSSFSAGWTFRVLPPK